MDDGQPRAQKKKNIKLTPISQTKSLRDLSIEPEAYRLRRHLGRPIRHWQELTGDSAIRAAQMTVTWEGGGCIAVHHAWVRFRAPVDQGQPALSRFRNWLDPHEGTYDSEAQKR